MKKIVYLMLIVIVLLALFFIPVSNEKTVLIKSSFLKVHDQLADPTKWLRWRPDLNPVYKTDSAEISIKKSGDRFLIISPAKSLAVSSNVNMFVITDGSKRGKKVYSYSIFPDINPEQATATVVKKTNLAGYLLEFLSSDIFADTHIDDLKHYLETDSLLYGRKIVKIPVPGDHLISIRKTVIKSQKFVAAAAMLQELKNAVDNNKVRKIKPLIAQFLPVGKDSAQVTIGFFIDKEIKPSGDVNFVRMPTHGKLLAMHYHGIFSKRQVVYDDMQQYFTDHMLQPGVMPFETYLSDRLPAADADIVNIEVDFTTFL